MAGSFVFEQFVLDPEDRQLRRGADTVELNGRYFDALALLVREQGRLVSKDRFLDEVWRGIPVTDEALTQCVRTLRRQLGDDAARPRFIETVPKHGYRFIAPVHCIDGNNAPVTGAPHAAAPAWRDTLLLAIAGTVGGGLAGFIGGLLYGFIGASQPLQPGMGAASVLLVLLCVTMLVALLGAAGVALGIALARQHGAWAIAGGAAGGLFVGASFKLLGLDAFTLLVGQSPGEITGALEGFVIGAGTGAGAWLSRRVASVRASAWVGAACGGVAGLAIALLGGRMMLGSLDLLARQVPGSRLRLDKISQLFGEASFGPVTRTVTSVLEGALFAAAVVSAMALAARDWKMELGAGGRS
jgi:DNA-binding winged helix-turn-helix (wHTH) protein